MSITASLIINTGNEIEPTAFTANGFIDLFELFPGSHWHGGDLHHSWIHSDSGNHATRNVRIVAHILRSDIGARIFATIGLVILSKILGISTPGSFNTSFEQPRNSSQIHLWHLFVCSVNIIALTGRSVNSFVNV